MISATNTDLRKAIAAGEFREDLYYRLNLIEINVPALAERREDILALAWHFLDPAFELNAAAERALSRHDWPGNVRELQNLMQRASILARDGRITPELLGLGSGTSRPSDTGPDKEAIMQALDRNRGNVAKTARELGLSRQALYRRMDKFGLE